MRPLDRVLRSCKHPVLIFFLSQFYISQIPQGSHVKVFDMFGVLRAGATNQSELSVLLSSGVYVITVEHDGVVYTRKYSM